jgi:hypothetical protein
MDRRPDLVDPVLHGVYPERGFKGIIDRCWRGWWIKELNKRWGSHHRGDRNRCVTRYMGEVKGGGKRREEGRL